MSVLAILWPMLAALFLTLAVQQLVFWAFRRKDRARLLALSEALGASERRWNVIREHSPFLLLLADGQGCIEYVNPYFTQITGTSAGDVVGRPASDLLPGDVAAGNALLDVRSSIRKGIVKAHDGTDRSVVWWTAWRDDGVGPGSGAISVGLDVTGEVIAEAARDEAVARLRSALQERDRALEANSRALAELDAMKRTLEERVLTLQTDLASTLSFPEIVGGSDAMKYVLRRIEQVAPLQTTVVIEGETGVGKELVARAIHQRSARGARAMVTVNCAALPPTLVEDELFGHERGAFTGAHRARKGKFELADGSTLFLDELAELPLEVQGKLLRALQEGTFERVGGTKTLKVNVRVIAATSKNLIAEVEAGRFRQDLYYRLQVYPLSVPALRQRKEDIPALVEKFVGELAGAQGKHIDRIPQQVLDELCAYEWPGNVRELRNVIERGVIHSTDGVLRLRHRLVTREPSGAAPAEGEKSSRSTGLRGTLEEVERQYVAEILARCDWRIEGAGGAAELLGLHPNTLRYRLNRFGLRRPVRLTVLNAAERKTREG